MGVAVPRPDFAYVPSICRRISAGDFPSVFRRITSRVMFRQIPHPPPWDVKVTASTPADFT